MDSHRRVAPNRIDAHRLNSPFSCFDWVEANLAPTDAILRCFSLARILEAKSFIEEEISATGIVLEENNEILGMAADYRMTGLKRVSFWSVLINDPAKVGKAGVEALLGYAIFKRDVVPSRAIDQWHVFEAVFNKYPHEHNCVPNPGEYHVRVGNEEVSIPGVLYAQQNGLNKVCAHVALRSLLSRRVPAGDVSYTTINRLAKKVDPGWLPEGGLGPPHIRAILSHFKVPFRDIDYADEEKKSTTKDIRKTHPFQKFVYAGIESGCGALLGFGMAGPKAGNERHIIPFFGHTFNKDTWVPDADIAYFNVGGGLDYIPSESWTGSFLGHDDNFGPNLCIPRLYVAPEKADYVVELLHDQVTYSGVHAEAVSLLFLDSLRPHIAKNPNPWMKRLSAAAGTEPSRVVLRAVCIPRAAYIRHVREEKDWCGRQEAPALVNILEKFLPKMLWVVEVSLPHIFPATENKLGEILLNPFVPFDADKPFNSDLFLVARLPGCLYMLESPADGSPDFMEVPSNCTSRRPLVKM